MTTRVIRTFPRVGNAADGIGSPEGLKCQRAIAHELRVSSYRLAGLLLVELVDTGYRRVRAVPARVINRWTSIRSALDRI